MTRRLRPLPSDVNVLDVAISGPSVEVTLGSLVVVIGVFSDCTIRGRKECRVFPTGSAGSYNE